MKSRNVHDHGASYCPCEWGRGLWACRLHRMAAGDYTAGRLYLTNCPMAGRVPAVRYLLFGTLLSLGWPPRPKIPAALLFIWASPSRASSDGVTDHLETHDYLVSLPRCGISKVFGHRGSVLGSLLSNVSASMMMAVSLCLSISGISSEYIYIYIYDRTCPAGHVVCGNNLKAPSRWPTAYRLRTRTGRCPDDNGAGQVSTKRLCRSFCKPDGIDLSRRTVSSTTNTKAMKAQKEKKSHSHVSVSRKADVASDANAQCEARRTSPCRFLITGR
jgi:hypothetical protein